MSDFPWTHPDMERREMPQPTAEDRRFTRARVVELEKLLRRFASGAWTDDDIRLANELLSEGR